MSPLQPLPGGTNDFAELRARNELYIDKTAYIADMWTATANTVSWRVRAVLAKAYWYLHWHACFRDACRCFKERRSTAGYLKARTGSGLNLRP